ncbi:MAG: DUF86 domain-containing protein [Planctomycetaceae bacterium]
MGRDRDSLEDILNSIVLIEQYVDGVLFDQFATDLLCQDAVVRRFEIMGEAAKRVSEDVRNQFPSIPWKAMSRMRDRVIHGYDTIDVKIVWNTIQSELPNLRNKLQAILNSDALQQN